MQKIIKAVKLYLDNNIIHNDLKGQNILFNEKTQKPAIIDFGLMHSKKKKENASKNYQLYKIREVFNLTENKEIIYINEIHWSWPLENEYIEKKKFIKFIEKTPFNKHQQHIEDILKELEYIYKIKNINKINSILDDDKILETYYIIINDLILGTQYSIYDIFNDYLNNIYSIQEEYKNSNNKSKYYDEFLEIHLNTIDIYGLGIAFITSLKKQHNLLPPELIKEFYELFYRMITPIIKNRIHINDLLETYENILNKYIKEYNIIFINNNLIKIPNNKLYYSKNSKISKINKTNKRKNIT
jgi:serine/threonine protein kinase